MNNLKFIPYWYREKRIKIECKTEKIILFFLAAGVLVIGNLYLSDINKLDSVNNDIKLNEKAISFMEQRESNKSISDNKVDKILTVFSQSIREKVPYEYIEIQNDKIEIKIPIHDNYECINVISTLESIPSTKINSLITENDDKSRENNLKVVLELR